MSNETARLLAAVVLALTQVIYADDYNILAWFFDLIARCAALLAQLSGRLAINARLAYMEVIR